MAVLIPVEDYRAVANEVDKLRVARLADDIYEQYLSDEASAVPLHEVRAKLLDADQPWPPMYGREELRVLLTPLPMRTPSKLWQDQPPAAMIDEAALPEGWRAFPAPVSLRPIGNQWVGEERSAVLSVPSAVLPLERLFLLNPQHPDFPSIRIGDAQPFPLDRRLKR